MLDDYKYSIGRLVVYEHSEPKLPKQSYGQHGHLKTVGEIVAVDVDPVPEAHWIYSIRNVRNQEFTRVSEENIYFATNMDKQVGRYGRRIPRRRSEASNLAEMITRALSTPGKDSALRTALRELVAKDDMISKAAKEGNELPLLSGDYIRIRGDRRKEIEEYNNQYAKVLSVSPSDIAGIENPDVRPGSPSLYRTLKKYHVITSENAKIDIYDVEVKLYYTSSGRKNVLNWRAANFLAEAFGDNPPYNLEYEYLIDHVFTREELENKKLKELTQILSALLYVKGKMGLRDYQRRTQLFVGMPKSHVLDNVLELSRFDSKHNRLMTKEEISENQKRGYKLRRLLKS